VNNLMARGDDTDPVRATFVAILQQLNRVDSLSDGRAVESGLELKALERILRRFGPIDDGEAKVPQALGLLVHNGLVQARRLDEPGRDGRGFVPVRYQITAEGKAFLVQALHNSDRIP
jgi:hypothetical protein